MPATGDAPSLARPHRAPAGSWRARALARIERWWPHAVLLALAIGSTWLVNRLDTRTAPSRVPGAARVADFYMEDFTATTMSPLGRPARRLTAERMQHFPGSDLQTFTRPHLWLYGTSGREPWQVVSERGELASGGDQLMLLGEVDIWRNNPDGTVETRIETSDVRVLPDAEYAETDAPALITTQGGRTTGVGLRAFMKEGRYELLSDVHTIVERISR